MPRGPLFADDYRPQLTGHETFPLRYGWLKKAYDAVNMRDANVPGRTVFLSEDAIAQFGVGKNMVSSMRHWAEAVGVLVEGSNSSELEVGRFGDFLFSKNGFDPYLERADSLWLVHWQLAGNPQKTTWYWAFNHFPRLSFDRDALTSSLVRLAQERNWKRTAPQTVKRDVECFVRTYVVKGVTAKRSLEDAIESPLSELELIVPEGRRDGFRFRRGPKPSLSNSVLAYSIADFWSRYSSANTLSLEAIAHEPGSPGRVFLLDEESILNRLESIADVTGGAFRWSETAGLKQIIRAKPIEPAEFLERLKSTAKREDVREVA